MKNNDDYVMPKVGADESFVRHFAITGLFGYRSISLDSEYAATILIARNGAGKTTMLGALDAFLRCQFGRLADLTFDRIECRLRGLSETLILEKSELDKFLSHVNDDPVAQKISKAYELDLADTLFFVLWELPTLKSRQEISQHPIFNKIYQHGSNTFESTERIFQSLGQSASNLESPIIPLRDSIARALSETEIVYLPTYRRIELSLPEQAESRSYRRTPSIQARLGLTRRGLHAGDIQFGLSDISARLKQLHQEIMFESNQKYAEISANIIDDLISGAFENQDPSLEDRPSSDELSLFFERMKDFRNDRFGLYGPYGRPNKFPDLSRIYTGNVPANSEKFLTYFLGKLNSVIQKTRITEKVVEDFVTNCNRYLSADDPTTAREGVSAGDDKELRLDRASLEVSVWSKLRNREIPLDALSSGEKQMISLFARLYLYPNKKLVLIDEPELSLSLDWQRKILPDILSASLCKQVIAITHSPFIFDNDLDIFAKSIQVKISDSGCEGVA
ncbi:MAG: AAA family ATPase [Achromobacter mucicolens]|uniref:AAA family ATPase n=1 Tax=Achromobacter mucicolens TaxID=1389922 RepID=UPI003D0A7B61